MGEEQAGAWVLAPVASMRWWKQTAGVWAMAPVAAHVEEVIVLAMGRVACSTQRLAPT